MSGLTPTEITVEELSAMPGCNPPTDALRALEEALNTTARQRCNAPGHDSRGRL